MKTLTLRTKITSDSLTIEHLKNLIGKEVEIIINEVKKLSRPSKKRREWKYSGSIKKGGYDHINLRDLAYAENIDRH